MTIALAIALGWSLFQVARGPATTVNWLLLELPPGEAVLQATRYSEPLTWQVGGRILTFGQFILGLLEFAVVLAVAIVITRRRTRAEASPQDESSR